MQRFGESNLPDFDGVVLAALKLFMRQGVPRLDLGRCKKPLVVGSGNAAATGRILLEKGGISAHAPSFRGLEFRVPPSGGSNNSFEQAA
ncbi:MAG: hypothetical protein NT105_06385 [Verrucomicrobia bacterium]|nr:hypothetical protein [Verrucomicrobiota bacterium]